MEKESSMERQQASRRALSRKSTWTSMKRKEQQNEEVIRKQNKVVCPGSKIANIGVWQGRCHTEAIIQKEMEARRTQ